MRSLVMLAIAFSLMAPPSFADGTVVDKIYLPYVQPLEREIEFRSVNQNDDNSAIGDLDIYRLGVGRAWNDRLFTELYVIAARSPQNSLSVEAYELEAKWQLTEQGEYSFDWGALFELEKSRSLNAWESSATLLVTRELGRWLATANGSVIYEWGDTVVNEWESRFALQMRYRLNQAFEPALEFYSGQDYRGIGPVMMGDVRTSGRGKLHWELGVIGGLGSKSADVTWRGLLEYEF